MPLYYENRIPELQLTNVHLNADMEELLEEAELDEAQEREFAREYHLITRDERLDKIAEDLVAHFLGRGRQDKAMVVSIDKATAVRMYDKVRKYWNRYLDDLRTKRAAAAPAERAELDARIAFLETTDMAVVVSQSQNEVKDFQEKGLDILPHRKRMVSQDLETRFKDPDDPFQIVFVCAMWMTGFDVPSCSTIYLDKPMRNHTLMQTIARANRVFPDKVNGLIVDYVGVFRDLQKALAVYGAPSGQADGKPVASKAALVEELRKALSEAIAFCSGLGIETAAIQAAAAFERVALLDAAVDALLVNDETKRRYLSLATAVDRLFRAILPDAAANEFGPARSLFTVIADKIRALTPEADIADVMEAVEELLDSSVATEGYVIREASSPYNVDQRLDLSKIDFEALKAHFDKSRKHIEAEKLKGAVSSKLKQMVRLNRSRMDYLEKFQDMIDEYNAGSANIDTLYNNLIEFTKTLNDEDKRAVAEQLSEEELAVFDLLTRPDVGLTKAEEAQVKKMARELLDTLKREKLVLDWRKRQQARAAVRLAIETTLDLLPDKYTAEVYQRKCDAVFQHVYDSYFGLDQGIYPLAMQSHRSPGSPTPRYAG